MWCAIDDIVSGGSRRSWAVDNKMTIYHENQNPKSYLGYLPLNSGNSGGKSTHSCHSIWEGSEKCGL